MSQFKHVCAKEENVLQSRLCTFLLLASSSTDFIDLAPMILHWLGQMPSNDLTYVNTYME